MQNSNYSKNIRQYNISKVNVNDPGSIILMSYETVIASLRKSIHHIEKKNIEEANNNIVKAQLIVSELNHALKKELAKELCESLSKLYNYIYDRLIDANVNKDKEPIEECIRLLTNVYEGWKEIVKGGRKVVSPSYPGQTDSIKTSA